MLMVVDQLPWLGNRELSCLLLFTCNNVVSVWRIFLFLWVLETGYVILLWHSLSLPYNYFVSDLVGNPLERFCHAAFLHSKFQFPVCVFPDWKHLGPVVKSIVSLTTSLRRPLVNFMQTIVSNMLYFCWKNVRIFCSKKLSHFFNKKLQRICGICSQNFNKTLTDDIVNFTQPDPDRYSEVAATIIMIPSLKKDRSVQTVQTLIRLLLEKQSDQDLHLHLHLLDKSSYGLASLFEF